MPCRSIAVVAALLCAGVAGCGAGSEPSPKAALHLLSRDPEVGVACRHANSIACDRVGLAVWLTRPALRVTATIDGRRLRLHAGGFGGRAPTYWEGYLRPAGLLGGALKVTPDRGRDVWLGGHPKDARVVVAIGQADGSIDRASLTVSLRAGWG